jgi:hypothetical protein
MHQTFAVGQRPRVACGVTSACEDAASAGSYNALPYSFL